MKSILFLVMLMFLIMGTAYSQVEDFEDETNGATSFTVGGVNFTTTGDLFIEEIMRLGCNQSSLYLSSGTSNGGSSGSVGSFKVTNPGDKFEISTSVSWCAYLSQNDGATGANGDVKFIGTLTTGDTIEEYFRVVHTQGSYDPITFSSGVWENQELTELKAIIGTPINHLSLDNIAFADISTNISTLQQEKIKIYPNPAVGEIKIVGIDVLEVKIMDPVGRVVKEQSLVNQKIDISSLPHGIYFIPIFTQNQQITKRIIKH